MLALVFHSPSNLWLLLLAVPLWMLFRAATARRREAMRHFSGNHPLKAEEQAALSRQRWWFMVCYCAAFVLLVVALSRPGWKRVPVDAGSLGRDVLFLLDVSKSMLAEDMAPNRLDRAKQSIRDCLDSLEGDRVGLVIFAGSPAIVCPLTTDYGFFRRMLDEAAPENVSQGGTRIGDAILKTADKLLEEKRRGYQDVVLITDGGDQESEPEKAVKDLEEMGVFLIVVGIGDQRKGARIPLRGEGLGPAAPRYVTYKGEPVWTRLEARPLEQLAKSTRSGVFLNAGTRAFHLGEVYHRFVSHFEAEMKETSETVMRYREEFQWFLLFALMALAVPHALGLVRGRLASAPAMMAAAGILLSGGLPSTGFAQEKSTDVPALAPLPAGEGMPEEAAEAEAAGDAPPREVEEDRRSGTDCYNDGCRMFGSMQYVMAAEEFREALNRAENVSLRRRASYNLGNSYFRGAEVILPQDTEAAISFMGRAAVAFRAALDYDPDFQDAAWNLELARLRQREMTDALKDQNEGEEAEADQSEADESSQEGESEDEGEEMDSEDMEETEESGEGKPSDYSASDLALDLENEGLPPPTLEPEDIFDEEQMNNQLRQKKGSKYRPVEKDW